MPQLSTGAIKAMYEGDQSSPNYKDALVQIINIKAVHAPSGTRYRIILSDGVNFMQAMLATQHTVAVENGEISKFTVIRLKEFVCNDLQNRKILIVLNFQVVDNAVTERIGNPVNLESQAMSSAGSEGSLSDTTRSPAPTSASVSDGQDQAKMNSFGGIPAKTNTQPVASLFPIKGLNPYQNKWTIKARVSQKSDIKHWRNNRSDGKLFSVTLLDSTGEIKGTAFHEQVDRLYHLFEEDKVYYISRAKVTMAKRQFSTVDNEYELMFDNTTEIQLCNDDGVPKTKFQFVKIDDLDNCEKNSVVDIIGVVKEDSGCTELVSKSTGKPLKKRELTVVDDSRKSVRLTLWDKTAETFDASGLPIVAFKGLRVSDFGGRSVSLSASGTYKMNPDIPECDALRQWYKSHGETSDYSSFSHIQGSGPAGNTGPKVKKTLAQIKDEGLGASGQADYFNTKGAIAFIKNENIAYPACPDCKRKMTNDGMSWRCEKCQKEQSEPQWRFILTLSVVDATAQLFMGAFDETGTQILGKNATEMMALKETDESAYQKVFTSALFQIVNIRGRAKTETFNDQSRIKYSIIDISPVNFVTEGKELVSAIEALLPN